MSTLNGINCSPITAQTVVYNQVQSLNILTVSDRIKNFVSLYSFVMRTNMNLLFYLKKRSTYKNGPVIIYLRFTVNGGRAETSTGKSCDPNRLNAQAGRASGTKEDTRVLNAYLDKLRSKAQELHQGMTIVNETVTGKTVKNRFMGKALQSRTLVAFFEDHNLKMKSLIGREYERSTLSPMKPA